MTFHKGVMTMVEVKYQWMPHHEGAIPPAGQGDRISTYNVALEGWRRGLKLDFYGVFEEETKLKLRYSLSSAERKHDFQLSMGDKVSKEAFDICADKELTKQYLNKYNVPVPTGSVFTRKSSKKEIGDYADKLGYPVVLKPTDGNAGKGVFANVQTRTELLDLVNHVHDNLGFDHIIVEKFVVGDEYRIIIIDDHVIGSMIRRPASVLGDGKHTISQLIKKKNERRKLNPHMPSRLIRVDREVIDLLHRSGYSLKSIPKKGSRVFLRVKSNLSAGGDSIDTTDDLTPELKQIAINAGKAIPGLAHYGVDMIVNLELNSGTILEVNTRPGLGGHMFPVIGQSRDIASEIIDFYFPETKEIKRSPLFFDFDTVVELIMTQKVDNLEIRPTLTGMFFGRELLISGKVQQVGFRTWAREHALKYNLHGNIENLKDGRVRIRVLGKNKDHLEAFEILCHSGPEKAIVKHVEAIDWYKPLKIGFETIGTTSNFSSKEIEKITIERERLNQERIKAIEKFEHLQNHRTWRLMESLKKFAKRTLE